MRMKSYFAPTVEAAMDQARHEMGPEPLLVNSRKAPPEARAMGEYEAVLAVLAEGPDARLQRDQGPSTRARSEASQEDPVVRELIRLRRQIEEMGTALSGLNANASFGAVPAPEFGEVFSRLIEHGFSGDLAKKIVRQAHARLDADPASWSRRKQPFDSQAIERALRTELEAVISVDSTLGALDGKPRVLALVGP